MHLAHTQVYGPGHDPAEIAQFLALAALAAPHGAGAAAGTPPRIDCPGNHCPVCWEARLEGSMAREAKVTRALATRLRHLEEVEWAVWYVFKKEEKRVCRVVRGILEDEEVQIVSVKRPFPLYPGRVI